MYAVHGGLVAPGRPCSVEEALLARLVSACGPQGTGIKPWASFPDEVCCNDTSVITGHYNRADGAVRKTLLTRLPRSCCPCALAAPAQ